MSGNWDLWFTRTNFGGTSMNVAQQYTITLHRLDDSACIVAAPCYGGSWWNPGAQRYEGEANISVTPNGTVLRYRDVEGPDNSSEGNQYYDGHSDPGSDGKLSFEGTWSQVDSADTTIINPPSVQRTATFTLTQAS